MNYLPSTTIPIIPTSCGIDHLPTSYGDNTPHTVEELSDLVDEIIDDCCLAITVEPEGKPLEILFSRYNVTLSIKEKIQEHIICQSLAGHSYQHLFSQITERKIATQIKLYMYGDNFDSFCIVIDYRHDDNDGNNFEITYLKIEDFKQQLKDLKARYC